MRRLPLFLILLAAVASSQAKTQTVTSLSIGSSFATLGQAVTLTARVSPPGATGKVTFYDGVAILGSATLLNGVASVTTTAIGYGRRSLTALYGGDSNYAISLSPAITQNVTTKPGGGFVPETPTNANAFQLQPAALYDLNHDGNLDLIATASNGNSPGPATIWVFLGNGDGTFQTPQSYLPGVLSYGVAVADLDLDGNPDLIVTAPAGLATLIGKGDGTFKTGPAISFSDVSSAVRVADINADGKPDLVFLRGASSIEILIGNGDGTFQTGSPVVLSLASVPSDLLIADFNRDGVPDLAIASPSGNSVTVMIGTPGGFGPAAVYTSYGARSLGIGDFNGDGKLDLVVGNRESASIDFLAGNGDGTLLPARTIPPGPIDTGSLSISVSDFDGDGHADVVAVDPTLGARVMLGNGDGTFRPPLLFRSFGYYGPLLIGDLNHDGIADIVTGSPFPQVFLGSLAPAFTISATPNPAKVRQSFTLTITSSFPDATGTITITNQSRDFGTATLLNGIATFTFPNAPTGLYYLDSTYSGDSKYASTVLPELFVEVQQPIGISLSVSPNPAVPGQLVTLTATVSMNAGNAKVAFFDGVTPLTEQTLYSTSATYKTTLSAGVHRLTAAFPAYLGLVATSATVVVNVQAAPNGQLLSGPTYTTGSTPAQVLTQDLYGVGVTDLVVLNPSKLLSVFLGTGKGIFQLGLPYELTFVPGAMVATQFGFYGDTDFAMTDPAGNRVGLVGNGVAPGASFPVGHQPVAIATADFNGDGFADLVTANAGSNDVSLLNTLSCPGCFRHTVNLPAGRHPDAVVTGDFNNDGNADFAVANRDDNNVMVFLGNGDGTFRAAIVTPAGSGPLALLAGDLNGDGKTDLVAVDGGSSQVAILLGNGDGTFKTPLAIAAGTGPSSGTLVDLNGDGKLDLAVTAASGLLIFTGNGDGTFSGPVNYPQYAGANSVAAGAFSGDGRMDLAVSLPATNSIAIVINGTQTTTNLSVTPASTTMSGKVTLKAIVSPASAAGSVSFYDGVTQIGASPVSNGSGSFSTTLLFPGPHSLSARFAGASGYGSSTSNAISLQVSPVKESGLAGPVRETPIDAPENLIPGDFNKDGIEDFVFWRGGNGLRVLLGNGDGTFRYPPAGTSTAVGGYSPITADFNNDGNTDLAFQSLPFRLALGDGAGGFSDSVQFITPVSPFSSELALAAADFDGDGRTDLVFANPAGTADVVLGIGDGTFQIARSFAAGANPVLVAAGDFNQDGKADIIVANSLQSDSGLPITGALNVLTGKGDGTFAAARQMAIAAQPVSLALADFNGDGHPDVAVAHAGPNQLSILAGKGDGTFAPAVIVPLGGIPQQLLAADLDGDGHPDLVVMFTTGNPAFAVFYGNGDGTFAAPVNYPDLVAPSAIALGDVNGDGRLDVIVAEGATVNVFAGALGSLAMLQGSPQSASVGTAFPVAFAVSAPPGSQVTFAVQPVFSSYPGGSFAGGATTVTVTAGSSGVATAPAFTANGTPGSYIVIAFATSVARVISFSLTNNPGPPATLKAVQGSGQSAYINNSFGSQIQVRVLDSFGNGIPGVSVTFTAPSTGASGTFFSGGTTAAQTTFEGGYTSSPGFTANRIIGTYSLVASVPGLAATATFTLTNLPLPAITIVSGANQSAILNATFSAPLVAKITDSLGNPVQFAFVTFTAPANGPTAMFAASGNNSMTTISDQQGFVGSSKFSAAGATGPYAIVATVQAYGSTIAFPATNTANPPGQLQPQSISFPVIPQHTATDPPFTLIASASSGLPVSFSVTSGPGAITGSSLRIYGPGAITVQAVQAGNAAYLPADPVSQTLFLQQAALAPTSVSPASGSASSQDMTFGFRDARGVADLGVVNILMNNFLDGRRACYLAYSQPSNVLYLVGDDGATLSAGAVLNSSGSTGNSQCTVSWGSSPVTASGTLLTLRLTIAFSAAFTGNRVIYLAAGDGSGNNSGWQALGVWDVPGGAQATTTAVMPVSPPNGSGGIYYPTQFAFTFSDTNGYQDLGIVNILLNNSIDGRRACYLAYSRPTNTLYLVDDAGDAGGPFAGGAVMSAAGSIQNSQCTVNWGASAANGVGNNLTLTLNIAFSAPFDGNRVFYLAARDMNGANNSDWQAVGTWTVQ